MRKKLVTILVLMTVMMILIAGCGNTVETPDISGQSDSGEIQNGSESLEPEDMEEQNTIPVTGMGFEVRTFLYRVLFHHPDDMDSDDDEVLIEYEYDEAGKLFSESNNIIKIREEYEYNSSGQLVKSTEYFQDGIYGWCEYEYDTQGYLIRENHYGSKGNKGYYQIYENDSFGNAIKEEQYYSDDSISSRVEYEYDTSGKLTEKIIYKEADPHGNYEQRYEYIYDTSGNLIREDIYLNDEFKRYQEYIYGSDGNLFRREVHNISSWNGEDIIEHYYEYTYTESGDLLTEVMYDRDGNVFYDTINDVFVKCLRYEYKSIAFCHAM